MEQDIIMNQIAELEREIAVLPDGSIAKKTIRDKDYYYHRININGKRTEKYVSFEEVDELKKQIEKRKALQKKLKDIKRISTYATQLSEVAGDKESGRYRTLVRFGDRLKSQIALSKKYKKRIIIDKLREYVLGESGDKVFILYGLRRTGKTTMIRQIITELSEEEFEKAAFIQVMRRDSLDDIAADMRTLETNGFKYVFIDEITLLEDFIEGAAIFSDIYASSGMKIVLSGTDSLGFAFSREEQLYDRCIMLHTTFIPYREFEEVLGIAGIDEYIRYGGTMSLGGVDYHESIFSSLDSTEEYIDTAIAKNIQHSLKMYQEGGHFRLLTELYEKGELTNIINRVVEDINHRFTKEVVERTFKSHDIAVTATNLLRDKEKPVNIKEHMDVDTVTDGIMQMLDLLSVEEQSIDIDSAHMSQIKEYLVLLDLITEIDVEFLPDVGRRSSIAVIAQPGMRYAQAGAIVQNILQDEKFKLVSAKERRRILDRLISEISGRMMEEIVLLETKLARTDKKVFKLQFAIGEFDMVVFDDEELECEIYEIKYSQERVAKQYRHLVDKSLCDSTSFRYGEIVKRCVIYRGDSCSFDGIEYVNVEEYLKRLVR